MDEDDKTLVHSDARRTRSAGILGGRGLLVVLSGNFFGRTRVVGRSPTVIGRASSCDLVIEDPLISRRHCQVTLEPGGEYMIEDLSSTNATLLNAKRLDRKERLLYGDRVVIGGTILRFFMEEEVEKK